MTQVKLMNFSGRVIDHCDGKKLSDHKGMTRFATGFNLMKKYAAGDKDKSDFDKLTDYDPEFLYIRVRAVTAGIPNNNGDLFEIEELSAKFHTFIDQRVFKNHKSEDVTNAVGQIVDVLWVENPNDKEHPYVECLLKIDKKKDPELVRGVEKGYITDVSMGAVISGTSIMLENYSIKNIEDMDMKNDKIRTYSGNVSGIRNMQIVPYSGEIYKVKVLGINNELGITHEHPVYIIPKDQLNCDNEWNSKAKCFPNNKSINKSCQTQTCTIEDVKTYVMEFVEAESLRVGDYVALPFPAEEVTPEYVTKEFARLLGYYVAEGWVRGKETRNENMIQFCLSADESEYIDEVQFLIKSILGQDVNISVDYFLDRNGCYITVWDEGLHSKLSTLGGKHAKNKILDGSVILWDYEMQKEFIGAYINGDGFQQGRDGIACMSTASEGLSYQIQIILSRLGIISNVEKLVHVANENSVVETGLESIEYQISIGAYYAKDIAKYSKITPVVTSMKSDRKFIYKNYLMSPVVGIRTEYFEGFAYNIESDIEESFIANRMAVHNCRVEYSVCSCCGNKAHTETDYCDCVKKYKGQKHCPVHKKSMGEYGIYESNFGVEFFELSFVTDGADREAIIKEIVASDALSGQLHEKLSKIAQILIDSRNPIFQENGRYMRHLASCDIISTKDQQIVDKMLDMIETFID